MLLKTDQMACLVQEDVARVGQRCNCERNSNNNNSNTPSFVVRTIRTYVFNMKTWLPPPSWQTFFWHITRAAAVVTSGNYTHTRQANDQLLSSSSSCNIFFLYFCSVQAVPFFPFGGYYETCEMMIHSHGPLQPKDSFFSLSYWLLPFVMFVFYYDFIGRMAPCLYTVYTDVVYLCTRASKHSFCRIF